MKCQRFCYSHMVREGLKTLKSESCMLFPMSESPSWKREGLQDNATGKKGKFISDSSQGPLLHPTQWCRSESPELKLLHKFIGWTHAIGLSGLVTSLQSNFIGQNFHRGGTFLGVSAPFLISYLANRVSVKWKLIGPNWQTVESIKWKLTGYIQVAW